MSINLFLKKEKGGFMVLTMVLLVTATLLSIVMGLLLRSVSNMRESSDSEKSLIAWSAVNACGEYALLQLSTTTNGLAGWDYASTTGQSLDIGAETCYIYPIATTTGSDSKFIKASSTVSLFTKKIIIEVATNTPSIIVRSWNEVADF